MRNVVLCAVVLFSATMFLYWPGREFEFVWDDQLYIQHNEFVRSGLNWRSFRYAFEFSISNWHPLVWLSWMADTEWLGDQPSGYRTSNYVLHAINAILLFVWLRNLTSRHGASLFVAAVFAVHPLHVESVQWISERKDVLSLFFGLLTLLVWQRYLRDRRRSQLAGACLLFLASLMSKQMFVTLPAVLLLLDYWPLQRVKPLRFGRSTESPIQPETTTTQQEALPIHHLLWEKAWFIGIAAAFCVVAIVAQRIGGTMHSFESFPLSVRVANAIHCLWLYLGKALSPRDLIIFYPHPGKAIFAKHIFLEFAALVTMTIVLMRLTHRRYLIVGWLWFLVTMLPVLGLVQIGDQQMADRYAYVPMIGIYWASTWWLIDVTSARWERIFRLGVAATLLALYSWKTHEQIGYWKNMMTLHRHMVIVLRDRE